MICDNCKEKFYVAGGVLEYRLETKQTLHFCSIRCAEQIMLGWNGRKERVTKPRKLVPLSESIKPHKRRRRK